MRTTPPAGFDVETFYKGVTLFQSWEVFPGHRTTGSKSIEGTMRQLSMPARLDGMRVLDIGAWNGFFSFECIRRGAKEVVSLGPEDPADTGFSRTAELLGIDNVRYVRESLYNLPRLDLGQFDIVLFLGVIYHLRHPLLALDILYDNCARWLYLDCPVIDNMALILMPDEARAALQPHWGALQHIPMSYFSQVDEVARRDPYNWFMPNHRCLRDWISTAGFEIDTFNVEPHWVSIGTHKVARNFEPWFEGFNPAASQPRS